MNIFIFRRDLRTVDNTTLNLLKETYKDNKILPIFIFNKKQIDKDKNKYYSANAVQFLFESLDELPFLNFYYTDNDIVILNELKNRFDIKAIGFNRDYTPFAIKRDEEIRKWSNANNIEVIADEDYTLHKIGTILKEDKTAYQKYTPFYKKTILKKPASIKTITNFNFIKDTKAISDTSFLRPKINTKIKVNGGRIKALIILKKLKDNYFKDYDEERDYPYLDKTTKLSAYIKFGCVSIREIYYTLPIKHGIIRELIWHDFYANITFFFPYIFNNSFIKKYDKIKWDYNEELLNHWKNGTTGIPLIDASMRQLNECGWMHNRCRMIVASFLTKNLFISWKEGERYFATKLVDYDPSSNNGGWQWCASTGTDSQPYFRIFSPSAQLKRFDNDCLFIKKWIPELKDVDNKIIHNWENKDYSHLNIKYPIPIINTKETAKRFIKTFKEI